MFHSNAGNAPPCARSVVVEMHPVSHAVRPQIRWVTIFLETGAHAGNMASFRAERIPRQGRALKCYMLEGPAQAINRTVKTFHQDDKNRVPVLTYYCTMSRSPGISPSQWNTRVRWSYKTSEKR